MDNIKRTPNYTAFLANSIGKGRVSRHSVARGKMAIVPESYEFSREDDVQREPVQRSVVSEAGLFDRIR